MVFSSLYGAKLDRELHSDDRTVLFTTARRKDAINEGIQQFAELTECLQRQVTATITSTSAELNLNSTTVIPDGDLVKLSKEQIVFTYTDANADLTILTGEDLKRREIEWLNVYRPGWRTSTASTGMQLPDAYYEREDGPSRFLGFTPAPSSGSSASMSVTIPYLATPAALTSDTQEPFAFTSGYRIDTRPYHRGIVHYAASVLELFRPDADASDGQMQKFLGYVARYVASRRVKNGGVVNMNKDYFRRQSTWQAEDPRR